MKPGLAVVLSTFSRGVPWSSGLLQMYILAVATV